MRVTLSAFLEKVVLVKQSRRTANATTADALSAVRLARGEIVSGVMDECQVALFDPA